MKRALTLGLVLLSTAVSATELDLATRNTREPLGQKSQWAPSGNFSALHRRAVFRGEIRSEARPYARARGEVAAGIGIFLSRPLNRSRRPSGAGDRCVGSHQLGS